MTPFEASDYRAYLKAALAAGENPRGAHSRLAEAMGCQVSFLSQVLHERAHLSLEHALRACDFLALSSDEQAVFMLLVQREKSGTPGLREFFQNQIDVIAKKREDIRHLVQAQETLSVESQNVYYSNWLYSGIHILAALPETGTRAQLKKHLRISPALVDSIVDFLVERGVLSERSGRLELGKTRLHLPKGSAFLSRHHTNWRLRAIESFEQERKNDLHYSAVMGLSEEDVEKIRKILLDAISRSEGILRDSREARGMAMNLDFFEI